MNLERPADDDKTRPATMIDAKVNSIYDQILEEICTELIFHVEIEGSINLSIIKQMPKNEPSHLNDYDIFNNSTSKEIQECICPICERTVGAIRFAPHLEKCVGMGRVSSRIANRRLATAVSGKDVTGSKMLAEDASDSLSSQNDTDWTMSRSSRKSDRKKRVRPRRSKGVKKSSAADNGGTAVNNSGNSSNHSTTTTTTTNNSNNSNSNNNSNNSNSNNNNNNGHSNSNSSSNNNNNNNNDNNNNSNNSGSNNNSNNVSPSIMDTITYNSMSLEERVTLLGSVCGVISEHTGRLCTRSIRCPKHTEQQRNNVRMTVLWSEMNEDFKNVSVRELKYTNNSQETLEVSNGPTKSGESSLDTSTPSTPVKRTRKTS